MRMTNIPLAPPSRRLIEHVCALVAATCLLLSGAFVRAVPLQAQTVATLKVMDWNIQHGLDMSSANNLDRVVNWIVDVNPHVVSLNEVEKQNGYNNNADEPAYLESALESRTGTPWYGCFAQREGAATGQGNLVLSRIRIDSCDRHLLSGARSVARATLSVNNVIVTVLSTHLDDASASTRATQVAELTTWAVTAPAERIVMGDFNASASAAELEPLRTGWDDAWAVAVAGGTAVSYPGNAAGNTRNGRIDYIWRSRGPARLTVQSAQVYDTGTISDHRPVSATYAVTTTTTLPQTPANVRVVVR
jgi:endonuclease/exonuclease/phosphatase family metal-dependent hydrolase